MPCPLLPGDRLLIGARSSADSWPPRATSASTRVRSLRLRRGAAVPQTTALVDLFHEFFGCGTAPGIDGRRPHFDDEVVFVVRRMRDLVEVVVPFMDDHLPPSYKRDQFERWRAHLLDHWDHRARRSRACSVADCDAPHRRAGVYAVSTTTRRSGADG